MTFSHAAIPTEWHVPPFQKYIHQALVGGCAQGCPGFHAIP